MNYIKLTRTQKGGIAVADQEVSGAFIDQFFASSSVGANPGV